MKLFIDTANIDEIREAASWGVISGVTTNPSLIAKNGGSLEEVIKEIVSLIDGPISAEVEEADAKKMVKQGKELASLHENIVIKLPMTIEGIKACKELSALGIDTNVTLVFTPSQALLATIAGASYVSPFLGRVDDLNGYGEGIKALEKINVVVHNDININSLFESSLNTVHETEEEKDDVEVELRENDHQFFERTYETKIIAASIRNLKHVEEAARIGVEYATVPFNVLKDMFSHELTTKGLEIFKKASKK